MRILEEILKDPEIKVKIRPSGIVDGPYGAWLLDFYNDRDCSSDIVYDNLRSKMNRMTRIFNEMPYYSYDLGYGLIGFLWTMKCIVKDPMIYSKIIMQESLLPVIEVECIRMIEARDYDLFRGANGLLVYLLAMNSLSPKVYQAYVDSLVDQLDTTGDLVPRSAMRTKQNVEQQGINLGVPHGVPGCILMLSRLYEYRPSTKCRKLLEKTIPYVINKNRIQKGNKFRYTYTDHAESEFAPLAWCYGDLSTGYAITKAGQILNNAEFTDLGLDILDATLERNDFAKEDLSLCHGAPSIAYIYHKVWKMTGVEQYQTMRNLWVEKIRTMLADSGVDKLPYTTSRTNYFKNSSLIYGYAGTQLALRTMKGNIESEWDEWMLL